MVSDSQEMVIKLSPVKLGNDVYSQALSFYGVGLLKHVKSLYSQVIALISIL